MTLWLKDGVGNLLATTTTDVNGFYQFLGLCGADYRVEVDLTTVPPNLSASPVNTTTPDKDSNPNPTLVNLPPFTVNPTIDFGFMPPCAGIIGDFVWVDANKNGLQDVGEVGIPNVGIELRKASDNSLLAVTTTDANGLYKFMGLCGGDYKVVAVPPPGFPYLPTDTLVGADRAVDSNTNPTLVTLPNDFASDLTLDFGYYLPAAIGDFVWHDINANGQQDGGEPGIPNVSVTLFTCVGGMVGSQLTDVNGKYLFTNLVPGCYYVTFGAVASFVASPANVGGDASDSDSVGGQTGQYNLAAGETNLTVDAGFYQAAALGDYVWNDVNINGIQDGGEVGIGGVTVTLYKCGGGAAVASMVTNAGGFYLFSNLVPGCYYVTFATPAGFTPTTSNIGNDALDSDAVGGTTGNYTLLSGETNLTVDAGFYKLAAIGDYVWKDLDADGIQEAGEPGIGGVLVTLLKCDGTPTGQSMNTSAAGLYLFSNLVPGCYKVQFATPAGLTATLPNVGNDAADSDSVGGVSGNYTLAPGETNLTVDAGFYLFTPPPPCVVATFDFTKYGDSSTTGAAGNIRNFSVNGVNLHVSAFSEIKGGAFQSAYLGLYSHGFGVTDASESGANPTHTVDNSGRNNYVLFEFSQTVAIDKAYLDYIVGDSDISVWIGNVANVYNSHMNLSAATLAGLGFTEVNLGGNASRWADINAGGLFGNVLVIAAKTTESDDAFKLSKIDHRLRADGVRCDRDVLVRR